jgi:hypothetical protein
MYHHPSPCSPYPNEVTRGFKIILTQQTADKRVKFALTSTILTLTRVVILVRVLLG